MFFDTIRDRWPGHTCRFRPARRDYQKYRGRSVIKTWAPVHLDTLLRTWFWKDEAKEIEAKEIWQKTCQFLYMPRLKNSNVFQATLAEGSETRDYFGLALGKRDDEYLSFTFGKRPLIHLEETWIIEPALLPSTRPHFVLQERRHDQSRSQWRELQRVAVPLLPPRLQSRQLNRRRRESTFLRNGHARHAPRQEAVCRHCRRDCSTIHDSR